MNSKDWLIGCDIKPNNELINALDNALDVQRGWCADAVLEKLRSIGFQIYDKGEVAIRDACLNATGGTSKMTSEPMLAVGTEELGKTLGDTIRCNHCGKEHRIEYGQQIMADGTRVPHKGLSFYRCEDTTYWLASSGGR